MPDQKLAEGVVLVADDSEAIRSRLAALVGHIPGVRNVAQVANARDVETYLQYQRPCLALIDVYLDIQGGVSMIQQARRASPGTTLIALTRFPSEQLATLYRRYGADHCYDKVSGIEPLIQTVREFIANRKQETPQEETP